MATAEIITVGTELLLGQLVDTNTTYIAKALADAGIDVHHQTSVGDNAERIAAAVRDGLAPGRLRHHRRRARTDGRRSHA